MASRSACWAASISSIALRRSATSVSRTVSTLAAASTDFARATSASAWASDSAFDFSAMAIARSCSSSSIRRRRWISSSSTSCSRRMRSASTARSWPMRVFSTSSFERICASSTSRARSVCSSSISARCWARRMATSRSWASRAYSPSCAMVSASFSDSRFLRRMAIIVSCSMSLRFFLRDSISSVSRVRPSASKALDGLNCFMSAWSTLVSEAASSSRPLSVRVPATSSLTPRT